MVKITNWLLFNIFEFLRIFLISIWYTESDYYINYTCLLCLIIIFKNVQKFRNFQEVGYVICIYVEDVCAYDEIKIFRGAYQSCWIFRWGTFHRSVHFGSLSQRLVRFGYILKIVRIPDTVQNSDKTAWNKKLLLF